MKNTILLIIALFLLKPETKAQTFYNSFISDNYAGPFSAILQPASLADNRYKWAIGFGGNYTYSNNYIGNNFNHLVYGTPDVSEYREPTFNGYNSTLLDATVFTGFLELTPKDAISYSWKYKDYTNYDGMVSKLTRLDFNSFTDGSIIGETFNQGRLSFQKMIWAEHNFTYSRVIVDKRKKFMKAGATFKILNGISSRFIYTEGGNVTFNANDQLSFDDMEFKYGKSDDNNQLLGTNLGVGMDLGFVYEFRPKYKTFVYEMDRKRRNPSKHMNKYKWKIGASITNIGSIKYRKDTNTYNFINDNNSTVNYRDLFNNKLNNQYIIDNVLPSMTNNQEDKDTNFRMRLPTALNVQFDYQIMPKIYLSYSGSLPIWSKKDPTKIHDLVTNTIAGRYEGQNFSVGLPVTLQRNGQVNVGMYGRVKWFFFGANNINNLLGQRKAFNVNVYAGIVIGKLHKMPSDFDLDKISDKIDVCPTDSGGWRMRGCPDADGDRIPDYKDFCPYVKGPKKYNGCPDTDKDGIMDYEDQCPNKKGLRVNRGCPDTDKDGIIDTVDRCPTIPGVYENNGCPLNPLVCCLDSDGDGISDEIDSCITEPGPAENNGCPTTKPKKVKTKKVKYPKIKKQPIEQTLEEAKTEIKNQSVKEVLEGRSTIDFINVYFDVDKSRVQTQYKPKLTSFADKINQSAKVVILVLGHTDSDGDNKYNLALSQRRSEAVRKYLVSKGVKAERIVMKSYGEERPAEENSTTQNKSKNRRVEVRIMSLHN